MPKHLNIPPVWTLIAIATSVALHFIYPLVIFNFRAIDLGIVAAGLYLIVAPAIWFKRKKTTIIPRQKPSQLISEGPFKLSRNPMYLGMVVLTFGIGLTLGSIQALIPAIWLFFFLQKNYVVPEERKMREGLGQQAEDYFATTGRWIWFL
jgi:protein-S-isoprenylcysteine O-methyltransferase Ste14